MGTTVFDLKEKNFSSIGAKSKSEGQVFYTGHVRFYAKHTGQLEMGPDSKLIIEREGSVSGEIQCDDLEVYGCLEGICHSSGRVIIYPGAMVSGEIHAKSLVVYPGSYLNIEGHTTQS